MHLSVSLLLLWPFLILIGAQEINPKQYTVYQTTTGSKLTLEELITEVNGADVLVFGEEHDDSIGHVLQYKLYSGLLEKYTTVTLSLEMFERDVQMVMDEYLAGLITESKLINAGKAWDNYSAYAPLVNLAKDKNQKVLAANVPGRYANMVSRKGLGSLKLLDKKARFLYAKVDIPDKEDAYLAKFNEALGPHSHSMGPSVFHAQLLRDATMAESITNASKKNRNAKILHLTGRFHSDDGFGTVAEIKKRKKRLKVMTISCFSDSDSGRQDWKAYKNLADFIILTKNSPAIQNFK
jgi:uncharacterized iron-regulated protein